MCDKNYNITKCSRYTPLGRKLILNMMYKYQLTPRNNVFFILRTMIHETTECSSIH